MLDVRRLRLLRELSQRGTIANVSAALHQTPSSVSQQLAQLEREAGVPLLQKVGRRLQLTRAGEVLVDHTGAILERLERAEADLAGLSGEVAGTLRIAVFQSAATAFMPSLLGELAALHPRLRVTMSQREPAQALRETAAGEFDLVIAEHYPGHAAPHHASLDRVALTTDALRLAVPAAGERWAGVRAVADAARVPWIMEPRGAASRHWAEQLCRVAGFEPDVRFETDDLTTHLALIASGRAVAIVSGLMWAGVPRTGRCGVRLVDLPGAPRRTVFTATRHSIARTPAVLACRRTLAEVVPADRD